MRSNAPSPRSPRGRPASKHGGLTIPVQSPVVDLPSTAGWPGLNQREDPANVAEQPSAGDATALSAAHAPVHFSSGLAFAAGAHSGSRNSFRILSGSSVRNGLPS